tara:strand:+ start:1312 stop:1698 length:387 start_codon:yes stop_codon:yes gene_type:complete
MSILGIGIDIVENRRIKKFINNKKFINRIFNKPEINKSKKYSSKVNYFAKKFAAKEAFVKALGIGIRKGINFKDINIDNDKNGKPKVIINSKVKLFIKSYLTKKKINILVSISDESHYSVSFVIIETK